MSDEQLEARLRKLEARVQELEDDRAIRELLARYGFNADCCRDDAYVDLYTEDGIMNLSTGGGNYTGIRRWEGKRAIKEFISDPNAHHKPGFYGNAMHVQGNNMVTHIRGNEAVVNSYSLVLKGDGPNVQWFSAGNNHWVLKKVNGQWLFHERRRRQIGDGEYIRNLDATPR